MTKLVLLSLLTALAFLVEPILGSEIASETIRPDVLLIPFIVAIVAYPGPWAVVCGGLIGLLCDCLTGHNLGPQMAAFSLMAVIGSLVAPRPRSAIGVFLFSFGCAAGAETVLLAIRLALDGRPLVAFPAAVQVAGTSLTTAILISGVCLVARRLTGPFERRRSDVGRIVSIGWQRSAD
jgi:rod shape-determining protein MreD